MLKFRTLLIAALELTLTIFTPNLSLADKTVKLVIQEEGQQPDDPTRTEIFIAVPDRPDNNITSDLPQDKNASSKEQKEWHVNPTSIDEIQDIFKGNSNVRIEPLSEPHVRVMPLNEAQAEHNKRKAFSKYQKTATPPEGLGFYSLNEARIPDTIKKNSSSVFNIAIASKDAVRGTLDDYLVLGKTTEDVKTDLMALSEKDTPLESKLLFLYQINECERKGIKPRDCTLFGTVYYGNAFVSDDGFHLRTALHNLKDFVVGQKKGWFTKDAHLPMVLMKDNKVIMGPEQLQARIVGIPEGAFESSTNELVTFGRDRSYQNANFDKDQAIIKVALKVGEPLPLARQLPKPQDPVFILGFPEITWNRDRWGGSNSDGVTIRVSFGVVMGRESYGSVLRELGFEPTKEDIEGPLSRNLLVTADSEILQLPGSPILNFKGEVVGLFSHGSSINTEATPYRVSGGTRLVMDLKEKRSNMLEKKHIKAIHSN